MNILNIDQQVLYWLNNTFLGISPLLDDFLVFLGVYLVYALPVIMLVLWFKYPQKRVQLALSFGACLISWFVITKLLVPNFIWFRERPDLGLIGLKEVFFHRPSYSFPSDHATALFALTIGLYAFRWKKVGRWFLVYALLILIPRVIIGIHYPLDIIGGLGSALIGVTLVKKYEDFFKMKVVEPIIRVLKKVKLA